MSLEESNYDMVEEAHSISLDVGLQAELKSNFFPLEAKQAAISLDSVQQNLGRSSRPHIPEPTPSRAISTQFLLSHKMVAS